MELAAEGDPYLWHVRGLHAILPPEVRCAQPAGLGLFAEAALDHGVPGDLAEVHGVEVPDLARDAVFLEQGLLGLMEHERVVRGERYIQATRKVSGERTPVILQKQLVVGAGRHCYAYLSHVEEVLQDRRLPQVHPVVDPVREQEGRVQVVHLPSLSCVRPVGKLVQSAHGPQLVQHLKVCMDEVGVVLVGGVICKIPLPRRALLR
mmetsp:Transcript_20301/g.56047  ORF Transcript_20301/g.56047 Transcript_20301/m.56047 type:complete len:206 (+) Transcript_20301:451-1068(+)